MVRLLHVHDSYEQESTFSCAQQTLGRLPMVSNVSIQWIPVRLIDLRISHQVYYMACPRGSRLNLEMNQSVLKYSHSKYRKERPGTTVSLMKQISAVEI